MILASGTFGFFQLSLDLYRFLLDRLSTIRPTDRRNTLRVRATLVTRLDIVVLALLLASVPLDVWGEPVTTIRNNGNPDNRVDLVILGDGYTAGELTKYAADVEAIVQGFFADEAFREYQRYFNVHRIDMTSNQSGADHPDRTPQVFRDTAVDATYQLRGYSAVDLRQLHQGERRRDRKRSCRQPRRSHRPRKR